jgi:hypothetical protein
MRFAGLPRPAFWSAVAVLSFAGCDNSKVEVYRAEKEPEAPAPQFPAANTAGGGPAKVTWQAPAEWKEEAATGTRRATFKIHGKDGAEAELAITAFPGAVGGLAANINRWRSQLQLPPLAESDIAQAVTQLSASGRPVSFVDMVSSTPLKDGQKTRILGGTLPLDDETWFFKLSGPDELVESQTDDFKKFLATIKVDAAPTLATSAGNTGSNTNAPTPPTLAAAAPPLEYKAPTDWIEQPLSPMRLASFKVTGAEGAQADVSVVSLGGLAGGDLANINRWRGQLKLAPVSEAEISAMSTHLQVNGHDFLVTDLVSEEPLPGAKRKARIVAAATQQGEQTWFVKMTGDLDLVEAQKDHFLEFLRSLSIPASVRSDESSVR